MLRAYAVGFYRIAIGLQDLRARYGFRDGSKTNISSVAQEDFQNLLDRMKEECRNLELSHTLKMTLGIESRFKSQIANEVRRLSSDDHYTESDLVNDLNTLDMSFSNELGGELIFRIQSDRNKHFDKDELFGPEVNAAFPSAIDNIRNAGTCFALEQWDASAFQSMTTLGLGLDALAAKFNVPFEHATWNTVIERIEAAVRRMDSSFGPDWKVQQKFFSEAASQFYFLKNAWRNYVMHGRERYDEGTSLSILGHVREFMQALAKGGLHE